MQMTVRCEVEDCLHYDDGECACPDGISLDIDGMCEDYNVEV